MRSAHPCLLKLLEGATSFNPLMLASVADQKDSILSAEPAKELPHLVRACQARLVHKVEVLLFRCFATRPTGQKPLQCPCFDTSFGKLPCGP
jgi:hypothetical protein